MCVGRHSSGKEWDQDGNINGAQGIQLDYFGARYYDPDIGLWISTDPVEEFWNSYSYVGADPLNLVDPWGLDAHPKGIVEDKWNQLKGFDDAVIIGKVDHFNKHEKEVKIS